jgi:hypothetical protein
MNVSAVYLVYKYSYFRYTWQCKTISFAADIERWAWLINQVQVRYLSLESLFFIINILSDNRCYQCRHHYLQYACKQSGILS